MYGYHGDSEFLNGTRKRAREVGRRVRDAVVDIEIREDGWPRSGGTGWFIEDGYVLTNGHVVDTAVDSTEKCVRITTRDGETATARIVGSLDERDNGYLVDLALLSVNLSAPETLSLGDSQSLNPAQPLVQVGHPQNFDKWMIALGRFARFGRGQTITAEIPIEDGNSGSPLTTLDGNVVGISTEVIGRSFVSTRSENDSTDPNATETPRVWAEYPYQEELLVRGMGTASMQRYYDRWR